MHELTTSCLIDRDVPSPVLPQAHFDGHGLRFPRPKHCSACYQQLRPIAVRRSGIRDRRSTPPTMRLDQRRSRDQRYWRCHHGQIRQASVDVVWSYGLLCLPYVQISSAPEDHNELTLQAVIIEAAMVGAFATGPNAGENRVGLAFGVVAFYAFLAVYGIGIDVCGVVWYSEVFPNHIRAKGICLSIATIALTDLVYLQATATAFANIGWHFYLLFICITFVGSIVFYFILPETRGIPLEEIAKIFGETDDIMVFSEDLHIDRNTHELVVEQHNNPGGLTHIATEHGRPSTGGEKQQPEKVEQVV